MKVHAYSGHMNYNRKPVYVCGVPFAADDADGEGFYDAESLAGVWYLVQCYPVRDGYSSGTVSHYQISRSPFRTNMSHQPREIGWLGSFSEGSRGIERYAVGQIRCRIKDGKVSFRKI